MTIEELVLLTKVKLEEYTPFAESTMIAAPQSEGLEVRPIESYIRRLMPESANELLLTLPLSVINKDVMNIKEMYINDDGTGCFTVDGTFLRVHTLMMHTWMRPVNVSFPLGGDVSEIQVNPYTRGGQYKPIVIHSRPAQTVSEGVLREDTTLWYYTIGKEYVEELRERGLLEETNEYDGYQLEAYKVLNLADNESDIFKARFQVSRFDENKIQANLAEFYATKCASKVYGVYGMTEQAAAMDKDLSNLINSISR